MPSTPLRVAAIDIVLTTVPGSLLGIGRFSRNGPVRGLCCGYAKCFRNIAGLLQRLKWCLLFTEQLPQIDQALHMGNWL
ncbi:MAG: transporter permease subunit [Polaromonas sp.]|nr:transporter permease subunit [Polaromonas sp.]